MICSFRNPLNNHLRPLKRMENRFQYFNQEKHHSGTTDNKRQFNKYEFFRNSQGYGHDSYNKFKKKSKHIYSAGILPYQVSDDFNIYFLLGKGMDGTWSDFGGKCEPRDKDNLQETAAREFYEESLGSVVSYKGVKTVLSNEKNYTLVNSKSLAGIPYFMFILRLPMREDVAKDRFKKTHEYLTFINANYQYVEKCDIGWISLDTLLLILDNPQNEQEMGWRLKKVFRNTLMNNKESLFRLKNKETFK